MGLDSSDEDLNSSGIKSSSMDKNSLFSKMLGVLSLPRFNKSIRVNGDYSPSSIDYYLPA